MTFDDLLAEVYTITNKPYLVDETTLAIKSATLKAHSIDFFSKDIYETLLTAESKDYIHSIDYISKIPNFRALKYLRKYDQSSKSVGTFLDVIEPEAVLDSYGVDKADVCYVAGRVLEIRSSTEIDALIMGCYVFPIVTKGNYSSWIAELYPYAIIMEAARLVFATVGEGESAQAYRSLVAEQYELLRNSALSDVGY